MLDVGFFLSGDIQQDVPRGGRGMWRGGGRGRGGRGWGLGRGLGGLRGFRHGRGNEQGNGGRRGFLETGSEDWFRRRVGGRFRQPQGVTSLGRCWHRAPLGRFLQLHILGEFELEVGVGHRQFEIGVVGVAVARRVIAGRVEFVEALKFAGFRVFRQIERLGRPRAGGFHASLVFEFDLRPGESAAVRAAQQPLAIFFATFGAHVHVVGDIRIRGQDVVRPCIHAASVELIVTQMALRRIAHHEGAAPRTGLNGDGHTGSFTSDEET
uniref:Uncharacterized protein n=1 Tax=Schlesneria paludicola TaxID=360056 RepID=A0A7C4QM99_9PLAN